MKPILYAAATLTVLTLAAGRVIAPAFAGENAQTRIENKADDAKTDAKKTVRKGKRKVRKATGTDTTTQDAKDHVNGAKDDVSNTVDKTKNQLGN